MRAFILDIFTSQGGGGLGLSKSILSYTVSFSIDLLLVEDRAAVFDSEDAGTLTTLEDELEDEPADPTPTRSPLALILYVIAGLKLAGIHSIGLLSGSSSP